MKHIASSKRTLNRLKRSDQTWTVIQFFFDFRAGVELPNGMDGMLRTLLHELVKKVKDVVQDLQVPNMEQTASLH